MTIVSVAKSSVYARDTYLRPLARTRGVRACIGRRVLDDLGADVTETIEQANAIENRACLALLDDRSGAGAEDGESGGDGGEEHGESSE
jgi:hypothetical protein